MMVQVYFIRVRGKVSGPFAHDQLQALQQRGHLGRFYEISEDRVNWLPASSLVQIFPEASPKTTADKAPPNNVDVIPVDSNSETWYYVDGQGNQAGPVTLEDLRGMVREETISLTTLVCRPGTASWLPLQAVLENMPRPLPQPSENRTFTRWEDRQGLRRVATGLTIHIVSSFLMIAISVVAGFGMLVALVGGTLAGQALTLVLWAFGNFINRIVETVANGFFAASPPSAGERALGVAALVLSLLSMALFFLPLVALTSLPSAFGLREAVRLMTAVGILTLASSCLIPILDVVRFFLIVRFLQALCQAQKAGALTRSLQHLINVFAALVGLALVTLTCSVTLAALNEVGRRDSAVVVILMATLVFGLSTLATFIYCFVRFLIALFQIRSLVGRRLGAHR